LMQLGSKRNSQKIIDRKADYVLAVKANQGFLEDEIKEAFSERKVDDKYKAKIELGHGRIETRTTKVIHDLDWVCSRKEWKQLYCIIMVLSKRIDKKQVKRSWQSVITLAAKRSAQKSLIAI